MDNPIHLPDNKKVYVIMFSTWIFYVIQILIILIFSLSNMDYYKETIVLNDLALFLISCGTCVFVTFAIARNNPCYYISSIVSTVIFDLIIIITLVFLIGDSFDYDEKKKHKGKKIASIIIKIFELLPGFLILLNPKLINANNNNANANNANNNNANNNIVNNNNANDNLNNNIGNINNDFNVNNGNINDNEEHDRLN